MHCEKKHLDEKEIESKNNQLFEVMNKSVADTLDELEKNEVCFGSAVELLFLYQHRLLCKIIGWIAISSDVHAGEVLMQVIKALGDHFDVDVRVEKLSKKTSRPFVKH